MRRRTPATRGRPSCATCRPCCPSKSRPCRDPGGAPAAPADLRAGGRRGGTPGRGGGDAALGPRRLVARYPALRGTIRDHVTQRRRPFVRFFACGQDLSHEPPDAPLPEAVASGTEPFMIVGAIAGGSGHRPPAAARIALGLIFLVAGLNGFLDFLPQPSAPIPAGAVALTGALAGTGYL